MNHTIIHRRSLAARRCAQGGAAMVELIFILLLIFLIIAGTLEVTLYAFMQNQFANAVREAGRMGAQIPLNATGTAALIQDAVEERIPYKFLLKNGNINVTIDSAPADLLGFQTSNLETCSYVFQVEADAVYKFGMVPFFSLGEKPVYARTALRHHLQPQCDA